MTDEGRGRGRGFALLDNLKKMQSDKSESTKSSGVPPAPGSSSDATASAPLSSVGGRGRMAALLMSKMQQKPGVDSPTSGYTSTSQVSSSEVSRMRGLQLLDKLKRRPVVATQSPTELSSITQTLKDTTISEQSQSRNKYYKEVNDAPPNINLGTTGRPVEVTSNFIRLIFKENCVFEYEVKFDPDQDYKHLRNKLLFEHKELFKVNTFDGSIMYLPNRLPDDVTKLTSTNPFDNTTVQVTIIFKRTRRLSEMVHIYNVLFKHIMRDLELVRFNREHFSEKDAKIIPQHRLEVWPGYVTAVDEYEGGLMLTLDSTHRVLRSESVLSFIKQAIKNDRNYKATLTESLIGCSVMTSYNKKLYRIDSIDYESNPLSTFSKTVKGETINTSYVDYYKSSYDIHIMDINQPLLISRQTKRLPGKDEPADHMFCLIPELCQMTGLTNKQRNDFNLMKDVATYTRITPNQRHLAFKQYIKNVLNNEKARNRLLGWGLSIAPETINITARTLPPETLFFGNGVKVPGQEKADWNGEVTKNPVMIAVDLHQWVIMYVKKDERTAQDFVDTLLRCGRPMGISVSRPNMILLQSENTSAFVQALQKLQAPPLQLVVIICPNARDDRYSAIKRICCAEKPIASQVINSRTLRNESKIRSITQKIALQINCKLGGTLWSVNIPFKKTMIVGIDSYHDPIRKNRSVCGFVASYNCEFTQWYSRAVFQDKGEEIVKGLKSCITDSLNHYLSFNGYLPERIIMYRDGVGDGQLKLVRDFEVPQLKVCICSTKDNYKPNLTYIVVQKRINSRIFLKLNGGLDNPSPGTVVDHDITRRDWYDFLIVSQKVRQGTVTPSHYIVVSDDSHTDADKWQRLTYKLCHLYYNWPGTVRVPAPCQYAHKLAYLVGHHTRATVAETLSDKLFFL